MTLVQDSIKQKVKIDNEKKAVRLAMDSKWKEAEVLNRLIIASFPHDLDARNRLGKALIELGQTSKAKRVFADVLSDYPNNSIANKNYDRLKQIKDQLPMSVTTGVKAHNSFIEESGKSALTSLVNIGNVEERFSHMPGQLVDLRISGRSLLVYGSDKIYLGQVESRLGTRLINLMNGGNQYDALITSIEENKLVIMIREQYQDPSQSNQISFLSRAEKFSSINATYVDEIKEFEELDTLENAKTQIDIQDWDDDITESVARKEFILDRDDEELDSKDENS